MFKIGRLWEGSLHGGEERRQHEEGGEGAHEPVREVSDVYEEGEVGEEPEEEGLEVGGGEVGAVEPVQVEEEAEPAAGRGEAGVGSDLPDGELGEDGAALVEDGGDGLGQHDGMVVLPSQLHAASAHLGVEWKLLGLQKYGICRQTLIEDEVDLNPIKPRGERFHSNNRVKYIT